MNFIEIAGCVLVGAFLVWLIAEIWKDNNPRNL
jgi:hypothetical protein